MKKIHLAFLWHQHQPVYKNPSSGVYDLPWVRLHATKDYYDTVAILDEFPEIKGNFNLVPSLLTQLDEYAQGIARDKYIDLTLKPAHELDEEEKIFVLLNFFMANWETMVFPYPRYLQLLEKRGRQVSVEELKRIQAYFKPGDLRDLQVWFNLAWMDPYWKTRDPLVRSLYAKGRDFTEEDKHALIKKQLEICGLIAGKYRQLQDRGQIEVSVTPFYHPILPLLSDTNNARVATPQIALPKKTFRHREDARTQIQKAVDYYTRVFGRPPRGMWPSEGSVSEDIVPLFAEAGIRWVATDEEILFRTLGNTNSSRRPLFKAYNVNVFDSSVNMVFRDHGLSDAIGFVYTRWRAEDAVADFMKRLYAIRDSLSDSLENNLVSVILDGENCWEYYANDGWDFLRLLYQTLANDPTIETVTLSDYLDRCPPKDTLKSLWAGSWINGNFGVWIGHAEDNLAWDYLNETRSFLTDFIARNPEKKDSPAVRSAWEQIYIAEGSDWNWWYGDDHSSSNDEMFDFLFRQHLISVYELLGERVPDYLRRAIKGIARKKPPALEPVDFLKPRIDGRITDYFEWQAAGCYKVGHSGGTMHQVETIIKSFYYGFDLNNLYFRFDLNIAPASYRATDTLGFKIVFLAPAGHEVSFFMEKGGEIKQFSLTSPSGPETATTIAADKIVELAIPLAKLALPEDLTHIEFVVLVMKNGLEVERWPYESSVTMPKPSDDFSMQSWSV